jgi:hypothetical protein
MGTEHLKGREPWFWVSAEATLHLQVVACPDGFVIGQNEANARLIAAAPELLEELRVALACADVGLVPEAHTLVKFRAAIEKAQKT